jgi:molecular chaperone GrpE (heat shock protein)
MTGQRQLLERIAKAQLELAARVAADGEASQAALAAQRRALTELRRDLLGDRRGFAVATVFSAVAPALDSLQVIRDSLDPDDGGAALAAQTDAVASALRNLLQSLGYVSFDATVGEPFAPQRMECLGHMEGAPGVVLAAVRPGYAAGEVIVRPAGVLVAAPDEQPDEGGNR